MTEVLDAAGVLAMRRAIYARDAVSRQDFVDCLAAGRGAGAAAPKEFADLLSEVATDLIVNQVDPPKYISESDADWLVDQLSAAGGLSCSAEYSMLTELLREAVSVPPSLAVFAVGEIEKAIVAGASDHAQGVVTRDDVEALRVCVFAATQGSSLHVTRESAEALFRIAHATAAAANDAAFPEFFAKAVGNYLMGIANRWTPTAEAEVRKEKWIDEKAPGLAGFLGAMFGGGSREPENVDAMVEAEFRAENAADTAAMKSASAIDAGEADWLIDHLTRDGALSAAEKQLLGFIKQEASALPPALTEAMNRQAA